jgi:glucokinase
VGLVVVTGLPGCGKTTLGRALAAELRLPFFDKDDILETLFDHVPVEQPADRQRLSRASDAVLETVARASGGAVLASLWRREALSETSGTPTAWLRERETDDVVEVHCVCPPDVAARRFTERRRHPSHLDATRTGDALLTQLQALSSLGPWGLGRLVQVATSGPVDVVATASLVRAELDAAAR